MVPLGPSGLQTAASGDRGEVQGPGVLFGKARLLSGPGCSQGIINSAGFRRRGRRCRGGKGSGKAEDLK